MRSAVALIAMAGVASAVTYCEPEQAPAIENRATCFGEYASDSKAVNGEIGVLNGQHASNTEAGTCWRAQCKGHLVVTFEQFNLESNAEFLYVTDANGNWLQTLTGTTLPAKMTLVDTSIFRLVHKGRAGGGFKAKWVCVGPTACPPKSGFCAPVPPPTFATPANCQGVYALDTQARFGTFSTWGQHINGNTADGTCFRLQCAGVLGLVFQKFSLPDEKEEFAHISDEYGRIRIRNTGKHMPFPLYVPSNGNTIVRVFYKGLPDTGVSMSWTCTAPKVCPTLSPNPPPAPTNAPLTASPPTPAPCLPATPPPHFARPENCRAVYVLDTLQQSGVVNAMGAWKPGHTADGTCWRFQCAGQLTLSFTQFRLPVANEFLQVMDASGTLLAQQTGATIPQPGYFTYPGTTIVRLVHLGQPGTGAEISWKCVTPAICPTMAPPTAAPAVPPPCLPATPPPYFSRPENCRAVYALDTLQQSGVVNAMGAWKPGHTADGTCWRFQCAGQLTLSFTQFRLPVANEFLQVMDASGTLLAQQTGATIPQPGYFTYPGTTIVRLVHLGQPGTGAEISWKCVTPAICPTMAPPTAIPATAIPATAIPATAIPPTQIPATAVPPTAVPQTAAPPTCVYSPLEFRNGHNCMATYEEDTTKRAGVIDARRGWKGSHTKYGTCWRLQCNGQLKLKYEAFKLTKDIEFFMVYDTNGKPISRYTGRELPAAQAVEGGAILRLADWGRYGNGVKMSWECVKAEHCPELPPVAVPPTPAPTATPRSECQIRRPSLPVLNNKESCYGNFMHDDFGAGGVIETYNTARSGNKIGTCYRIQCDGTLKIHFHSMNLVGGRDRLNVCTGTGKSIGKYTGRMAPRLNLIKGSIMLRLEDAGHGSGFSLTWACHASCHTKHAVEYGKNLRTLYVKTTQDVEQQASGFVSSTSGDLELVQQGVGKKQAVGIRWGRVSVPKGATIKEVRIFFKADEGEKWNKRAAMDIGFEASPDSKLWRKHRNDVSSRKLTSRVPWIIDHKWIKGHTYMTPNLAHSLQEVVSMEGWRAGNPISAVIAAGRFGNRYTGRRVAESKNGDGMGPVLKITYSI